ncbi:MAG: amidohydrolase [Dehalococcoidia bacterium]|nr:amidohydrolase [Dehalococcoidia bacterium]
MTTATTEKIPGLTLSKELLISSDSHVIEDPDLWFNRLPAGMKDQAPRYAKKQIDGFSDKKGGSDPNARLNEMVQDGVSGEVLYPSLALTQFGIESAELQEACFRIYNDWLADYCAVDTDRLVGIALLSTFNIQNAIKELERCRQRGLRGGLIWQVPHPDLPFTSGHYDPLWAAAEALKMPISLHILTGFGYSKNLFTMSGLDMYRNSVNVKLLEAANTMLELIMSGVFERFPALKFVIVENEIGWMPFVIEQWDRYYKRFQKSGTNPVTLSKLPSEFFDSNFYATFFNDPAGGHLLAKFGENNCMWSNDYPHGNSTWPHSREVIARDLGHLSPERRAKIVATTAQKLYDMRVTQIA